MTTVDDMFDDILKEAKNAKASADRALKATEEFVLRYKWRIDELERRLIDLERRYST